jgi:release factor glutamine methyltransferase
MDALKQLRVVRHLFELSGIDNADREAELICARCLGIDRLHLYKDNPELSIDTLSAIDAFVKRRIKREPLQYILGYVEFYGLKIKVGPGVLVPRPETELLAEEAIKTVRSKVVEIKGNSSHALRIMPLRILDLCTGSGCLALALAREFPGAVVYGTDTSERALQFARDNADINKIRNTKFLKGNLFDPLKTSDLTFDLIISNPPYIKRNEIPYLQTEIKDWEPLQALDGGEDGLEYYRMIIPEAGIYLKEYAYLMIEIGINQAEMVKQIAAGAGFKNISLIKDYAGIERIVMLQKE